MHGGFQPAAPGDQLGPMSLHLPQFDGAFGEQFLDVTVREAVAQISEHRHHDHLGREANRRTLSE
jgi:hypothetical protein